MTGYQLRPAQARILSYQGGRMGISAVPGSGKTWTLSLLAARIVQTAGLADDQEVLVVTLVNSAVENFYRRVSLFINAEGLLPYMGYRVRTLHGLAHDIVRSRPALAGLEDNFGIIDEREADSIRQEAAQTWLRSHPGALDDFLRADLDDYHRGSVQRERLPVLAAKMAEAVIRDAKDRRITPEQLRQRLDELPLPLPLAEMGCQIYTDYQRALAYRGAVDFDDLIRLALLSLESDPIYLQRLQYQWPYILEDEAQDSSRLQEEILAKLAGPQGNWVRVGDPNQAIYETFTTANPAYLRRFLALDGVRREELPNSGRSTVSIITLANMLVEWTQSQHPVDQARDALQSPPLISPVPPDDPQPNPPDDPRGVFLMLSQKYAPADEIQKVAGSLEKWLPAHPDWTVAVLTPRNERGIELAEELKRRRIPFDDSLLRSSSSTRRSAKVLSNVLRALAFPLVQNNLADVFRDWRRGDLEHEPTRKQVDRATELLRKLRCVEDYLWPGAAQDWLGDLQQTGEDAQVLAWLVDFRRLVQRWQGATLLPVDQMVLSLAQDLLSEPSELALAHKLAVLLRQAGQQHPTWRLPELGSELDVIVKQERKFLGMSSDDNGFDPERYKGTVVVSTMHRAKGLEWDRVYLLSVNNYDFPSGMDGDQYIAESWFLRDRLNLEAEALAQLRITLDMDPYAWYYEGAASRSARLDYVRERLRLLYVGITRARRELVLTWNTGRKKDCVPAVPLSQLMPLWEAYLGQQS
ncbi:MAG: ATP-dependent helicase [Chloroflexota bacterium]